jgi:hypothetical protein
MAALQQFEATEANLVKAERLWDQLQALIPSGIVFGDNPSYEERTRAFEDLVGSLPRIDGWKPDVVVMDLNEIAQNRLDALDVGMPEAQISNEMSITAPGRELREYRFRFSKKRRVLVRDALIELIDDIDARLRAIRQAIGDVPPEQKIALPDWAVLCEDVAQLEVLLGSASRPGRWQELRRHLSFGQVYDLNDIEKFDWPSVKAGLRKDLYGDDEPLPVAVSDLGELVAAKPGAM